MPRPLVTLLTDFGLRDPSAAICRAVILGIAPDVDILEISHEVRKFAIRDGALLLWSALPYVPIGFHVAVVDPGVGTTRRPVAVRVTRGDVLVGPDNGLLLGPVDRLGGVVDAVELVNPAYRLPVVTSSFHGRDVFAPAAAHLARGVPFDDLGPRVGLESLVPSPLPRAVVSPGIVETTIVYVDTFGNVKLSALASDLEAAVDGMPEHGASLVAEIDGETLTIPWTSTFGDVPIGAPLLYADSYGRLCIAVNQGSAAADLGLTEDLRVRLRAR